MDLFNKKKVKQLCSEVDVLEKEIKNHEQRIVELEKMVFALSDIKKAEERNIQHNKTKKWLNSYPDETKKGV